LRHTPYAVNFAGRLKHVPVAPVYWERIDDRAC